MDRSIVYAGEIPRSADFLGFEKSALYALGYLTEAVLGSPTCVSGLACAPTAPASLNVTVGVGSIYEAETVDATAFGGLGTDSNTIVKQGLLSSAASLAITPPSTSGYSQIYLVEAAYNDIDTNPLVLNYYNAANPQQPLSGPSNSGTSQNTVRAGVCAVTLKAGAAAPTGSQTAPSVDPGYVGLYLITVSNGQTAITSGSIAVYPGAPFIPLTLPQVPAAIQAQAGNWALDTGTANALAISLPSYTTLSPGMPIRIKKGASPNTGALTLTVNNGSPISVLWDEGSAFIGGDWPANAVGEGIFDGTALRMNGPVGPNVFVRVAGNTSNAAQGLYTGTDTGSADAIQVNNLTPTISAYGALQLYLINVAHNNQTTTPKIQIGTLGQLTITRADGTACKPNDIQAGADVLLANVGSTVQIVGLYTSFLPSTSALEFTSSTTWTVPPGVYEVKTVELWGGGGGGGGSSGTTTSSSGGGGGGYSLAYGVAVTPGQVITITIGAGGTGGSGTNYGTAGGTTTFGSTNPVSATGGGGGGYNATNVPGGGGVGSGGQLNLTGETGGIGFGVGSQGGCGTGGAAPFGSGAPNFGLGNNGAYGLSPGGGANGGSTGSGGGTAVGGNGAPGLVIISW